MIRLSLSTAAAALTLAGALPLTTPALAETEVKDIPVPKAVLATAFNAAFASMRLHVHNHGGRHGSGSGISWQKDDSYILLPNGSKVSFPVEEQVFNVPGTNETRKLKYYVNDLNSEAIQAAANGDRIVVDVRFESQAPEIKGECIRRLFGKWNECSLDIDRDIHLNNAMLGVSFKPMARNGSISFDNVSKDNDVSFKYDIKIDNRLCNAFSGICGWIEGKIKDKLTPAIKSAAAVNLSKNAVQDKVADAVKNSAAFRALIDPSWKVTKVTSSGGNFIVRVERPVVIDQTAVEKLSLAPVQAKITSACPATVQLAATIEMKHTVSGTGFLTYENGQKSGTFKWNAKAGQTVTSKVSRSFSGKAGETHNGSATMQVQWKGTDGKTYTKSSNKATFAVTCTAGFAGGIKGK